MPHHGREVGWYGGLDGHGSDLSSSVEDEGSSAIVMLSPRQLEIVTLIGRDGDPSTTVASKLGITMSTLTSHMARIQMKYPSGKSPREAIAEIYWRVVATDDARRNVV